MARLSEIAFVFVLVLLCHGLEARKLLYVGKGKVSLLEDTLVLNVLPKCHTSPSSSSDGGNAGTSSRKLFNVDLAKTSRYLVESVPSPGSGHYLHLADIDRNLESVPSPGAGHYLHLAEIDRNLKSVPSHGAGN